MKYIYAKKQKRVIVWAAYSRFQNHVIAYYIGEGKSAAKEIYRKVKKLRPNISHIYSDANSCYDATFAEMKIPEKHTMTKNKTYLIENSNSSIRDSLARFNRKSKRFSKSLSFLDFTLQLFFYKQFLFSAISS